MQFMKGLLLLSLLIGEINPVTAHTIAEMKVVGTALPFANDTLTKEQIDRKQYQTVDTLLNTHPSLTLKDSGGLKRLFIRGGRSNHTLVILDGIVLNDPSSPNNTFDFKGIDLASIEKLEVISGPKASFYGSGGLGGVLIFTSKQAVKGKHAQMSLEGGGQGYNRQYIQGSVHTDRVSGFVSLSRYEDGLRQRPNRIHNTINSDYERSEIGTLMIRFPHISGHKLSFFCQGHSSHQYSDTYDEGLRLPIFNGNTFSGQAIKCAAMDTIEISDRWTTKLLLTQCTSHRSSQGTFTQAYRGHRTGFDIMNTIVLRDDVTLDIGVLGHIDTNSLQSQSVTLPDQVIKAGSVRARGTWDISPRTTIYVSGRFDAHSRYANAVTWQGGLFQEFVHHTSLEVNVGTGFKYPSLSTRYGIPPFQQPNPTAKPERSFSVDVAMAKTIKPWDLTLKSTLFYTMVQGVLAWNADTMTMANLHARQIQGVELSAQGILGSHIDWRLGYTYLKAQDRHHEQGVYMRAIDVPDHKFVLGLTYFAKPNLTFFVESIHSSSKKDYSGFILDRTTDVRCGFNYAYNDHICVNGRVENALNESNEHVYGFGRRDMRCIFGLTIKQ